MEAWKNSQERTIMEWLKKTWKFLVGALVTIVGVILLSKRKDNTPEIIRETTKNGNELTEKILKSNEESKEKKEQAENEHQKKLKEIERVYENKKRFLSEQKRKKIESALNSGAENAAERATAYLAAALNAKNGDLDSLK